GQTILHLDFHPWNILMTGSRPVIIDWENICCGHPLADVGRSTLLIRQAILPPGIDIARAFLFALFRRLFVIYYLQRYFELRPGSREEMETWMPVLAAARLREGIQLEEETLLKIAEGRK
ncbi:MAG: phosphotransferase, partial [Omnitrophica WOR_2 bacterium]